MSTLVFILLFLVVTSRTAFITDCKKCEKSYTNCINLSISQSCELARRLCLEEFSCQDFNLKNNNHISKSEHVRARRLSDGVVRRRLSSKHYALERGYPIPGNDHELLDHINSNNNGKGKLRLHDKSHYMIEDFIIECKVIFDEFNEKILDNSYIDIDKNYIEDDLEIGSILINPLFASQNYTMSIDTECNLMPVVKVVKIIDKDKNEMRIYVEEPKDMFEYIKSLDIDMKNATIYDLNEITRRQYEAVKKTLESFDGNGRVKLGKYKCVWTNKTSGKRYEVDKRWCELKYGSTAKHMGSKLGNRTSLKHVKEYESNYEVSGYERTWPESYYNNNNSNLSNFDRNSILDKIIMRRRLGFFDFLNPIGDFFVDIGTGIVNGLDAVGQSFVDTVEWVADLVEDIGDIDRIINAIKDFVELVIQILSGEIDQTFGLSYGISAEYIYEVSGSNDKKGIEGSLTFQAGCEFLVEATLNIKASYDLFGNGILPKFESFRITVLIALTADAYVNLEINGAVNKEFEIFAKEKRKVVMAGPVPIVITLGGTVSLGFDMAAHFSWSAYADTGGELEFGVEYVNGGWNPIKRFDPPEPKFVIGQNIEEDAESCGLSIDLNAWIKVEFILSVYDAVHISSALILSAPYELNYPWDSEMTCNSCSDSGLNMAFKAGLDLEIGFEIDIKGLASWSPDPLVVDIMALIRPSLPGSVQNALDFSICDRNVFIAPLYYPCCGLQPGETRRPTPLPTPKPVYADVISYDTVDVDVGFDKFGTFETPFYGGGDYNPDNRQWDLEEITSITWRKGLNYIGIEKINDFTQNWGISQTTSDCPPINLVGGTHIQSVTVYQDGSWVRGLEFKTNSGILYSCRGNGGRARTYDLSHWGNRIKLTGIGVNENNNRIQSLNFQFKYIFDPDFTIITPLWNNIDANVNVQSFNLAPVRQMTWGYNSEFSAIVIKSINGNTGYSFGYSTSLTWCTAISLRYTEYFTRVRINAGTCSNGCAKATENYVRALEFYTNLGGIFTCDASDGWRGSSTLDLNLEDLLNSPGEFELTGFAGLFGSIIDTIQFEFKIIVPKIPIYLSPYYGGYGGSELINYELKEIRYITWYKNTRYNSIIINSFTDRYTNTLGYGANNSVCTSVTLTRNEHINNIRVYADNYIRGIIIKTNTGHSFDCMYLWTSANMKIYDYDFSVDEDDFENKALVLLTGIRAKAGVIIDGIQFQVKTVPLYSTNEYGGDGGSLYNNENLASDIRTINWAVEPTIWDSIIIRDFTGKYTSGQIGSANTTSLENCNDLSLTTRETIEEVIVLHNTCTNCGRSDSDYIRGVYLISNYGNSYKCVATTEAKEMNTFDAGLLMSTNGYTEWVGLSGRAGSIIDKLKFQWRLYPSLYQLIKIHTFTYFINDFRVNFYFDVNLLGSVLCGWSSYYDNGQKDRRIRFRTCAPAEYVNIEYSSVWSGYTALDGTWTVNCPSSDQFISAIGANYDSSTKDRAFRYRCSRYKGATTDHTYCFWTDYQNNWESSLNYYTPRGYAINGFGSTHDNSKEDRRFKFKVCRLNVRYQFDNEQYAFANTLNDDIIIKTDWWPNNGYNTNLDERWIRDWSGNDYLSVVTTIGSKHDDSKEDRLFKFKVAHFPDGFDSITKWTGWQNSYDNSLSYKCPENNYFFSAMQSAHDDGKEDRIWSFKCARPKYSIIQDCFFTGWAGTLDSEWEASCPTDYAINGMYGYHDDAKEDRLYRFRCCKIKLSNY